MNRYENLPPAIAAKLDESVRRVRRIIRVRGICVTVAVFVAALLGMMAIDAMVMIFSSLVRWGLWCAAMGAAGWTAWTALIKPLRRKFTAAEVAALIERNHPELEERLSTVVELMQAGDDTASRSLMEAVTMDAVRDVGTVKPTKEFTTRTVKPRLIAAAVALGILAVLFAAFPKATARLVARAIIPSAEVDNIYASSLKVVPGDQVVLAGSSFSVSLAVEEGFPDKAYVRTRTEGKRGESVERMTRTSALEEKNAFYSFEYPSVDRSFTYRVNCGSALTRGYTVTVVPVPAFSDRRIRVTHPDYTGRPPDEYTNTAEIAALAGAKVAVSVRPDRDDIVGEALLPRGRRAAGVKNDDGRLVFSFNLGANDSGEWGIALGDQYGFSNTVEKSAVRITKDEPPQLKVLEPAETSMELPPYGQVPFSYEFSDDYGVAGAALELSVGGSGFTNVMDLAYDPSEDRRWSGFSSFELSRLKLPGGAAMMRLRLAVKDNCPEAFGGPHVTYSSEYSLKVVARAETLDAKMLADEIKSANLDINEAKKALETAKRQLEEAAKHIDQKNDWRKAASEKKLENAKKNLQKAEDVLKDLTKPEEDDLLSLARLAMKPVLDEHVTPDRQAAEDLLMTEKGKERSEPTKDLAKRVEDAMKALNEAKKAFDAAANEAVETQKLAEMAEREQALAEMAENGEISADELVARQQELEEKFESDFKDELDDPMAKNQERASNLADKADKLEKKRECISKMEDGNAKQKSEQNFQKELDSFAKEADAFAEQASKTLGEDIPKTDKQNMPGEKQKWEDVRDKFEKKGQEMRGEDAGQFDEMRDDMKAALDAAKEAAEAAKQQGDQQQGDQQQGDQQQGDQQQGDQQQGDQQKGDQPQDGQQSADSKDSKSPSSQMKNAAQQMKNIAQKMMGKAQANAAQMNMPLEDFMPQSDEPVEVNGEQKVRPQFKTRRARSVESRDVPGLLDDALDWFKMKSDSSSGAESSPLDDVPAEYRGLVREYFKALNEGSSK